MSVVYDLELSGVQVYTAFKEYTKKELEAKASLAAKVYAFPLLVDTQASH